MTFTDHKIFNILPGNFLLLQAVPEFIIEAASGEYLGLTRHGREIIGKPLFTVFPDNPDDPQASGVKNLTLSLQTVIRTREPHSMHMLRYDTQTADSRQFQERYWEPLNIPVLDDEGNVQYILHSVEEVTDQVNMNRKMKQNDQNLQQHVANAVLSTQEMERLEISRELHDNINQILITAKMYLGRSMDKDPVDAEAVGKGLELVDKAIGEIKKLSNALTHVSEEEENLVHSLESLLENILPYDGININKKIQLPDESLINAKVKQTILRIVQEQLANILKHAEAKNLFIGINFHNHVLSLTLRDDGKGFSLPDVQPGLGFQNMKARVALMDGKLEINSSPGDGCTIRVHIPVQHPEMQN